MSNIRSCGSLASGNQALLKAKSEPVSHDDRMRELELKKQEMMKELDALNQSMEDAVAEASTLPASEAEILASQKRSPPPSTTTTPVKQLQIAKKARAEQETVKVAAAAKTKPVPSAAIDTGDGGSGATEEPTVKSLQHQLESAMQMIATLQLSQSAAPSPATHGTRSTPGSASKTPSTPATTASKVSSTKSNKTKEAEDTEEKENQEALSRYKMVDARLRRLCERKPTGKLNVPQSIHEQWLQVGKPRDELRQLLEQLEFDKEKFVHKVTKMIEMKKEDSQEVLKGWFTQEQMRGELKWSASYIKDAVAYCKQHGLVKNDKYSAKVYKYFVEYSDKEATKRTKTELDRRTSTGEADTEVELSGDLDFRPTSEDASGAVPADQGHKVLSPENGEKEVEQKFADGMLTKMSKITDLISKLDDFASGEDSSRVKKCVDALESKLNSAQTAYDAFVATRSSIGEGERTEENKKAVKDRMKDAMEKASALASAEAQAKALEKSLKKKKKDAAEADGS